LSEHEVKDQFPFSEEGAQQKPQDTAQEPAAGEEEQVDAVNDEEPATAEPVEVEESPAAASEDEQREDVQRLQEELKQQKDSLLRARAEMDNVRKRLHKEKQDGIRFANESLLREILPVKDNLERAVEHATQKEGEDQSLLEGVKMTLDQFERMLGNFGVQPVEAQDCTFDPALHEAMGQKPTEDQPPGTVVEVMQPGYMLNDRLLRPALVMVAQAPQESGNEGVGES